MFKTKLILRYDDGEWWTLMAPLIYECEEYTIIVPPLVRTNFASVPRFFWRLLPPVGNGARGAYGLPSVLHDYCYQTHLMPRWRCDELFFNSMKECNVSWWRRWTMWLAVRLFGWNAYNKYGA